jgi:hypothetical protein
MFLLTYCEMKRRKIDSLLIDWFTVIFYTARKKNNRWWMCRRILCCVLCQSTIDNISIDIVAYIHGIAIFTGYFFSLDSTRFFLFLLLDFFLTMSKYYCSNDIFQVHRAFSLLFYFILSCRPLLILLWSIHSCVHIY